MNNLQWIGIVMLLLVVLIMLTGCSYDIEWHRGEAYEPIVMAGTCGGPTTDWPCLEAEGCAIIG